MDVQFTSEQKAFVREATETGRFKSEEAVVQEALSLWEERERRRFEILAAVALSEKSLARGEARTVTSREQVTGLADDVKQRAMARLAAERTAG